MSEYEECRAKTEIAIRAAFKAIDNGKQVAVLVPTTVLAFQHFKTFSNAESEHEVMNVRFWAPESNTT